MFFTFDFHILSEQRHIGGRISLVNVFKKKGDSLYEVMEVRADTITYNWNCL